MLPAPDNALSNQTAEGLLTRLLSPDIVVFSEENRRISEFLQAHPGSGEGYLQAAILCGVLAFNDHSGMFRDIRPTLNRMTAFLAAADVLGVSKESPGMKIAEALRLTLCGQQRDALAMNLPSQGKLADWKEVIRLRNSMDWRSGRSAAAMGSPALQHEYFRALTMAVDEYTGIDFLKEIKLEEIDLGYCRIANERNLSVSGGHLFSKPVLVPELQEIAYVAKGEGYDPSDKTSSWLKEYLDTPEGSPVTSAKDGGLKMQVAGRNLVAGMQQRSLMQGLDSLYGFLNDMWGVKDGASEVKVFIVSQLPSLRYKPFLERSIERDASRYEMMNDPLRKIIQEQPEMVTPSLWASLRLNKNGDDVPAQVPDWHRWFHPEIPSGTAFEEETRLYDIGVGDETDKVWMTELLDRAPYSSRLAYNLAYIENGSSHDHIKPAMFEKYMADMLGFRLVAMRTLANAYYDQPAEYEKYSSKVAEINPDEYLDLGFYFRERDDTEKAAKYYQLGFEKARDRVRTANNALWLVKYLHAKGDDEMAEKVGADAAEAFSYTGLQSYIWLQEATGRWSGALDTARKCDERYSKGKPLEELAHLIRAMKVVPQYVDRDRYERLMVGIFPSGIQEVTMGSFSAPPPKGVFIRETNAFLERNGLRRGMIIVALDGYRTDTFDQYLMVRAMTTDPRMRLVVWDGQKYSEVTPSIDDRRFGVDMGDYVARAE
ncbi:MAG: serine protease [Verrucomicrobia bacterium]|nr:serine protease [Verrucomicrobiota bacterium]